MLSTVPGTRVLVLSGGICEPCTRWLRTTDVVQLPHLVGEAKEAQRGLGTCPGETANQEHTQSKSRPQTPRNHSHLHPEQP